MVRWLSQRPWSRAPKHPSRFLPEMMNPAPQMPHFVRPENRYCGRFAALMAPAVFIVCRVCFWRDFAAPDLLRHYPQLRDFPRHPLGCRVEPRHSLSGVRILHVAKTIPDQPADVELVVE